MEYPISRRPHHVNPELESIRLILAIKNFASHPGVRLFSPSYDISEGFNEGVKKVVAAKCPPEWVLERIEDVLRYDPGTGWLIWTKPGKKRNVGQRAGYEMKGRSKYRSIGFQRDFEKYDLMEHNVCYFLQTGDWPKLELDHKNLDGSDNRWDNLRPATALQQNQNRRAHRDSKTGVKGVTWKPHAKKYAATIQANKKWMFLGYYNTVEEAAAAYAAANAKYHDPDFRRVE